MYRLLLALTGVLVLPVLTATPAYAVDHVICVNTGPAGCDQTAASISAAIVAANANALDDTILVGAGTYSDGPYSLNGVAHALTLKGAGEASTTLTLPASASLQDYVVAQTALVRDLTILMAPGASSASDSGLALNTGATADHVTISGLGTENANGVESSGSQLSHVTILMPKTSDTRALYLQGGSTVTDSSISGGVSQSASTLSPADTLSRVTIRTDAQGVSTDSGTIAIDDVVIDLGTSNGTGIALANFNNSTSSKTVNANHVTIVGGTSGSRGVWAYAASPGGKQLATVTLTNSVIRGPATSLVVEASNTLPVAPGNLSTATIAVSHSDYKNVTSTIGANGSGGVVTGAGNVIDVDPLFVDAGSADYRLSAGSPLIDKGDPAAGGPATDLGGSARVVDGDAVLGAVRDMGAYEGPDTIAPNTTIVSGPSGPVADKTPTFTFSSVAGATYACRVDAAAYAPCTSPFTTGTLAQGAHSLSVRAADLAANVDPSPAVRSFTVDTVGPVVTLKKKPAKQVVGRTVKFKLKASEPGTTFRCSIDGSKAVVCKSRTTFKVLFGKHTVKVYATDLAGNRGRTTKYSFRRVQPRAA